MSYFFYDKNGKLESVGWNTVNVNNIDSCIFGTNSYADENKKADFIIVEDGGSKPYYANEIICEREVFVTYTPTMSTNERI